MTNILTMMRTIYTLLLAALCWCTTSSAQNLATWALTANGTPSFEASNINADDITRGNGISGLTYSVDGATSFAWEGGGASNEMDYYELCLDASTGNSLLITGLNFSEMRNHEGIRDYVIMWSKDGFETSELLATTNVPDDELTRTENIGGLNIRACENETVCFRWYGFNAENFNGEWSISNVEVVGSTNANCTPPTVQASALAISNPAISSLTLSWANGNGDGTLIVGRAGGSVSREPCSGELPTADSDFGAGDDLGGNTFVVYAGNGSQVTVTGLTPGQTYSFRAFTYDNASYCFQTKNAPLSSASTLCHQAGTAPELSFSALNNEAHLRWNAPLCYDEVLIVASESSIASVPTSTTGEEYMADAEFGDGTDANADFLGTEFPVYQGTGSQVTVTGLDNDVTYYLRIYVRWGTYWSVGNEVVVTPLQGCADINNDIVFINEFHATNAGDDLDEGIEIAGPAGVDLNNYTLTFYSADGYIDTNIGDNGNVYLYGNIDNEDSDFGAMWYPIADLQYFAGVVLWNEMTGEIVEFLSYRIGSFPAYEGIADGMNSTYVTSYENLTAPVNFSIQRSGTGTCPSDLAWQGPVLSSRGEINNGQQAVLPISLASFNGTLMDNRVLLKWQTASELNNDYMSIEHSMDARNFREIGTLKGQGNSQIAHNYELWHYYPEHGINYYRLRQVDFDGTVTYHGTVAVRYQGSKASLLAFPTIAQSQLTVNLSGTDEPAGTLSIIDAMGYEHQQWLIEGEQQRDISLNNLPSGSYWLRWVQEDGTFLTTRFIKQ
jgi:hypothetical protein